MCDILSSIADKVLLWSDRRTALRIENAKAAALQTLCCHQGTIFLSFHLTNLSESTIAITGIEIGLGVRYKCKIVPSYEPFQGVRETQLPINLSGKESTNVICMVFVDTEAVKPSTQGWYAKSHLSGISDVLFELPSGYDEGRSFAHIHAENPNPTLRFSACLTSSRKQTTLTATAELLPFESFVRLLPTG